MIKIRKLSHNIDNKNILQDINVDIPKHQLTAIIGPNGAGKSTLLNVMARLLPIQCGSVHYGDINLQKTKDHMLAKILAILSQQSAINSRITITELLMFGRYPHHQGRPAEQDRIIVHEVIKKFNLAELQHRYLNTLSGGQRQQALIAMVFCQSTPYILLDEPLNNLDLYHSQKLMTLIRGAVNQQTVVIVLHDINQAIAHADNIIAMKDGKIAYHGKPCEVITSENIKSLFNVDVEIVHHKNRMCML